MFTLYKKYWRTAFDIGVIALTVWLVMFTISYLYKLATPVFLSFLVFLCIEPLAKRLNKIGVRKSIASGISVLLFTLVLLAVISGLGFIFYTQVMELRDELPRYQDMLQEQVARITTELESRSAGLDDGITAKLREAVDQVTEFGAGLARDFLAWMVGFLTSFSTFVVNFSIAIVLAYFLSIEIDTWKKLSSERAPKTLKLAFSFLRENVFRGIAAYLKAQAKLISITFVVIFAALLVLGVKHAFAISLLAAFFDVLPLLGVSAVFLPWIGYLLIIGDIELALWLAGLLIVVTLTRQVLEPRITGQTVGVSAFTMLAFMMVSLSLFGVTGLILAPILMILIKALYDQGYFHQWIRLPKEEFAVSPLKPQDSNAE